LTGGLRCGILYLQWGRKITPARRKLLIWLDALMLTMLLLSFTGIASLPILHMVSLALIASVTSLTPTFYRSTKASGFVKSTVASLTSLPGRPRGTQILGQQSQVQNDERVLRMFADDKESMQSLSTRQQSRRALTRRWGAESVRTDASMIERRLPLSPMQARSDRRRSLIVNGRWNSLD
jgi:hypothetical protein